MNRFLWIYFPKVTFYTIFQKYCIYRATLSAPSLYQHSGTSAAAWGWLKTNCSFSVIGILFTLLDSKSLPLAPNVRFSGAEIKIFSYNTKSFWLGIFYSDKFQAKLCPTHCVVSSNVDAHRQAFIWMDSCTGRIQAEFPHGNSHPIHPEVSETQDPFSISDNNSLKTNRNQAGDDYWNFIQFIAIQIVFFFQANLFSSLLFLVVPDPNGSNRI